jgi:hypothetical protein
MVEAAYHYALIRQFTTTTAREVEVAGGRTLEYHNSNTLVKNRRWHIGLSKTGFTNEAGRCLVMRTAIAERPVIIVLLDSWGRYSRIGDANRIRKWIETSAAHQPFGCCRARRCHRRSRIETWQPTGNHGVAHPTTFVSRYPSGSGQHACRNHRRFVTAGQGHRTQIFLRRSRQPAVRGNLRST